VKQPTSHRGVIFCNGAGGGANGWSFPLPIERKLQRELRGPSVLHLFGGRARFGVRLDMDPITQPDVIGDAWLPPFGRDSFDVVVLDPPYVNFGRHCREVLGMNAAWIARKQVVWFSAFAATSMPGCSIRRWWTVIIGNDSMLRQLVFFEPLAHKKTPPREHFTRGPAQKYNRWFGGNKELPFPFVVAAAVKTAPATATRPATRLK
jgi:hypothetical protein